MRLTTRSSPSRLGTLLLVFLNGPTAGNASADHESCDSEFLDVSVGYAQFGMGELVEGRTQWLFHYATFPTTYVLTGAASDGDPQAPRPTMNVWENDYSDDCVGRLLCSQSSDDVLVGDCRSVSTGPHAVALFPASAARYPFVLAALTTDAPLNA